MGAFTPPRTKFATYAAAEASAKADTGLVVWSTDSPVEIAQSFDASAGSVGAASESDHWRIVVTGSDSGSVAVDLVSDHVQADVSGTILVGDLLTLSIEQVGTPPPAQDLNVRLMCRTIDQ